MKAERRDGQAGAGGEFPAASDSVAAWLAGHGGARVDSATLLGELCARLLSSGVPLWRVSYGVAILHPQVRGHQFVWRRATGKVTDLQYRHGIERDSDYLESPVRALHRGAAMVRRRLEAPASSPEFPILDELRTEGATDYAAMPLAFSTGQPGFVSWVTDRPGGFGADDLRRLEDLLPILALRLELEASYHMSKMLLQTYLGEDAAGRVLAGEIRRGQGRRIRAAILLSDLKGFTALSDRLPTEQVIEFLDRYFDIVSRHVRRHGGQVLEFIGDGLLAVFDVEQKSRGAACCQAVHAAIGAARAIEARRPGPAGPMEARFALHLGDVVYGNIGAVDRLDFTVIGPAVNEAARIEGLCRDLERRILISASFARSCTCKPLVSLGRHRLRGVSEAQEIFTLPPEELAAGAGTA